VLNVAVHQDFKAAEALLARLLHCLRVRPVVVHDAVAGDYHAGSVGTPATVYEHRPQCWILQCRKNLLDLLVCRCEEAGKADANVLHTGRLHCLLLPLLMIRGAAKVQHSPNTAAGKACDVLPGWLFASINVIVDAVDLEFGIFCG